MDLPFSLDQFMEVFRSYNLEVWPAQIVAVAIAAICMLLAMRGIGSSVIGGLLALLWFWMGLVYHIVYFSSINPAAYLFGGLFILQGLLFLFDGILGKDLKFRMHRGSAGYVGLLLIAYALIFYPLLGILAGHRYPSSPTFGLPCPTTIFTFGLLLWTSHHVRWYLLAIPVLWSIIGSTAALRLGMVEDLGLPVAAVLAVTLLWLHDRERLTAHPVH
jgi:hypothetical protein